MTVPAGKIEIVCEAGSHPPRVVKRVHWNGGGPVEGKPGARYVFSTSALGTPLIDDKPVPPGHGWQDDPRYRWQFRCTVCNDCVEARAEHLYQDGGIFEKLVQAGVSRVSLTGLRAILF
jgi:hypothetical protein